jgi:cytochrome c oxidase subunit 2
MMSPATVAQSVLDPAGPQSAAIASLWWLIFWITTGVFLIVMAALAGAVLWRRHDRTSDAALTKSVTAAVGVTVVILFVWLIASVRVGRAMGTPKMSDAVTISVTGRQWWWQVEYVDPLPALRFRTSNELHIPVGRPVVVNLASRDVIHSFWVPNLHGKRDLIPGYTTAIWLQADKPGVYRGQCAEFCGFQHAKMAFYVTAESEDDYQRWVIAQRQEANQPTDDMTRRGQEVFLRSTCTQCHTIRGTIAGAGFGPDLTHVGSRGKIAAGMLETTHDHIAQWVRNPQAFKPGTRMPPQPLGDDDLQALAAYLESLK